MKIKSFYIKTLGCKVNQYESQVIRENFLKNGYAETDDSDKADFYVVNTCTVTSTSDSKSLKALRSGLKKNNKCIIATGCMIENKSLNLHKLKGVDFIIRNKDKYNIPYIINDRVTCHVTRNTKAGISSFKGHTRAFVKIQDGCNNACSYCKVRIVRGRSMSRHLKEVIDECKLLIENGYKEIVLTGICLGSYGKDISKDLNLSLLIKEICRIQGDWRLRLSSIEPNDVTEELISQIKSEDRLCRHLHIPFQSGDNGILKKMNRPYTARDYTGIVNKLRKAVPDIAISTDMMVGFPGEKQANFQNTVDFIKEVRPMRMHVFGFSKRPGTPAYNYKDNVSSAVKKEREDCLLAIGKESAREYVNNFIGKKVKVLIEGTNDKEGLLSGYTDTYIKVLVDGPDSLKARLVTCQLTSTPALLPEEQAKTKARAGLTNQKVYGILLPYSD